MTEPEELDELEAADDEVADSSPDDDEAAAEALAAFLAGPVPDLDDSDDDVEDEELPPVERRLSAVEQLEDLLAAEVPLSQIELVTASDGSLISCERAVL
jgi:hypothetical protein